MEEYDRIHRRWGGRVAVWLTVGAFLLFGIVATVLVKMGGGPFDPSSDQPPAIPEQKSSEESGRPSRAPLEDRSDAPASGFPSPSRVESGLRAFVSGSPVDEVVDGDFSTGWPLPQDSTPLVVDVGTKTSVSGLEVAWHSRDGHSEHLAVEASADGHRWQRLLDAKISAEETSTWLMFPSTQLRYIRLAPMENWRGRIVNLVRPMTTHALDATTLPTDRVEVDAIHLPGDVALDADFETVEAGPLAASAFADAFGIEGPFADEISESQVKHLAVVEEPAGGGNALRVTIPSETLHEGANITIPLEDHLRDGASEAFLTYRLFFDEDFNFEPWGGKLPGLAGGRPRDDGGVNVPSGCVEVDGTDGFSARLMWTSWREEYGFKPLLGPYVYHAAKENSCGDGDPFDPVGGDLTQLRGGRWYHITTRVRLNDPGESNGVIESWVNGGHVFRQDDYLFRRHVDIGINAVMLAVFFGGNDKNWIHQEDEVILLDDIKVYVVN